jgi:hypothetical protein
MGSAVFSDCGKFRYRLERTIPDAGDRVLAVVMVNPSTADAESDDPTIRKVQGFARRAGFGRVIVGNLFAFRSTDIKGLAMAGDPRGPDNNAHLKAIIADAEAVLFAWGPAAKVPKQWRSRWRTVADMALAAGRQPLCLGIAQDGHPRHPLMVAYSQPLEQWSRPQ